MNKIAANRGSTLSEQVQSQPDAQVTEMNMQGQNEHMTSNQNVPHMASQDIPIVNENFEDSAIYRQMQQLHQGTEVPQSVAGKYAIPTILQYTFRVHLRFNFKPCIQTTRLYRP